MTGECARVCISAPRRASAGSRFHNPCVTLSLFDLATSHTVDTHLGNIIYLLIRGGYKLGSIAEMSTVNTSTKPFPLTLKSLHNRNVTVKPSIDPRQSIFIENQTSSALCRNPL